MTPVKLHHDLENFFLDEVEVTSRLPILTQAFDGLMHSSRKIAPEKEAFKDSWKVVKTRA